MNSKKLALAIQKMVKEEVKKHIASIRKEILKEVRYELGEALNEIRTSTSVKPVNESVSMDSPSQDQVHEEYDVSKYANLMGGADDSGGNLVSGGPPKRGNGVDWNTGNPAIDQVLSETKGGIPQQATGMEAGLAAGAKVDDSTPDHVKEALTKDYSSMLKAMDKKKR